MAAVAKLGRFMKDPKALDPVSFVADRKLLDEFEFLRQSKGDGGGLGSQKIEHLRITQDVHVYVKYPNRWILVTTQPVGGRAMVAGLQLHDGGSWRNAADLLALQRKVKTSPLADWLGGISMIDRNR